MYPYHLMKKRTHYYGSIYRQSSSWLKKPKSLRVAEKQAHERIQYKRFRKSQKNHWIGDNLKEKYPQN